MLRIFITGYPTVTVAGTNYEASIPVTAYEEGNTPVATTMLVITGAQTDTKAQFLTKLKTASDTWEAGVVLSETMRVKLAGLYHMEIK